MTHILYFTAYPKQHFAKIMEQYPLSASIACQKFNSLLIQGFVQNDVKVDVLCPTDILLEKTDILEKNWRIEEENNVMYHFCPQYNSKFDRKIKKQFDIYHFIKQKQKEDPNLLVILDYLAPNAEIVSAAADNLTVIVTDMPEYMYTTGSPAIRKARIKSHYRIIHGADTCMLLTEQMTDFLKKGQNHTIIEGLVDSTSIQPQIMQKENSVMYFGAISYFCGIDKLAEAFHQLNCNTKLVLYGNGDCIDAVLSMTKIDNRIIYGGIVPNEQAIQLERRATLLVNPRPIKSDLTKYSFPSKTLEYMTSGTALLTTRLPGIPTEYEPYVYYFDDDSTEGLRNGLNAVLSMNENKRKEKAKNAQEFVQYNKTEKKQVQRLLSIMIQNKK